MKTAELSEERNCQNCAFQDGCKGALVFEGCEEHKFDWEVDDLSEAEKKSMIGDYLYQCYKEE